MTFVKTDCPECGERILLDIVNGYGYCMYCGAKVDPEGLTVLPSPIRVTLRRALEAEDPYAGAPWYGRVRDAGAMLRSGDTEGAVSAIREAFSLAGGSDDARADVVDAVDTEIIETIVSVIDSQDAVPYRGGMMEVFDVCEEEAGMGLTTQFMDLCLLQYTMEAGRSKDRDRVGAIMVSIAYLLRDYLSVVRRPDDAYGVLMTASSIMSNLADAAYPDGCRDEPSSREDMRCLKLVMRLALIFSYEMEGMPQKSIVKLNRSVMSKDFSEALADLNEAYSKLTDPDEEAFLEPAERYADFMLFPDQPVKQSRKAKGRSSLSRSAPGRGGTGRTVR